MWVKNPPPKGTWHFFTNNWELLIDFFTHFLNVPIYARLLIFIQLSPILTKLCHIKHDYAVYMICSKCPPSAETHAFRRLRKSLWEKFSEKQQGGGFFWLTLYIHIVVMDVEFQCSYQQLHSHVNTQLFFYTAISVKGLSLTSLINRQFWLSLWCLTQLEFTRRANFSKCEVRISLRRQRRCWVWGTEGEEWGEMSPSPAD